MAPGTLKPQEHGGAILHGSLPGTHAGGTGRPPSEVRAAARDAWYNRLPKLLRIADGIAYLRLRDVAEFTDDDVRWLDKLQAVRALPKGAGEWLAEFTTRVERASLAPTLDDPPEVLNRTLARAGEQVRAMAELSKVGFGSPISTEDVRDRLARQANIIASRPTWVADDLLAALDEVWV